MTQPIVWSLAGSDSSAGAGIQADIKTCNHFGVHCCTILTAVTAQNTMGVSSSLTISNDLFSEQINTTANEFKPCVIKSGMLASYDQVMTLAAFLNANQEIYYICDPVIIATSGSKLCSNETVEAIKKHLLPRANLITPNAYETEFLLDIDVCNEINIDHHACRLLKEYKCESILLKGGDFDSDSALDYWLHRNGESLKLILPKININNKPYHGTGCTLSSAIAANIANGESIQNAIVVAKQYVTEAIKNSKLSGCKSNFLSPVLHDDIDVVIPKVISSTIPNLPETAYLNIESKIGFYPIVESSHWVEKLCRLGVKTIQLRIKNGLDDKLESEIIKSIKISNEYKVKLFINDYWKYAIKHKAYGVHLGQEDIESTDLVKIHNAGIRLGISTHDYYELGRALQIKPSYIALGPIYHTTSKQMRFAPQGLQKLKQWRSLIKRTQLVAIGGIDYEHMADIYQSGADSIAVISYVTQAENLKENIIKALEVV